MPYGQNALGQVTTPGGCRVDRGRCIQSIDWNFSQEYCRFVLRDSAYYYVGTGIGELIFEMVSSGDPGCHWNGSLGWNKKSAGLLTIEPPHDDENDLWISYSPPDYIGVADIPP